MSAIIHSPSKSYNIPGGIMPKGIRKFTTHESPNKNYPGPQEYYPNDRFITRK